MILIEEEVDFWPQGPSGKEGLQVHHICDGLGYLPLRKDHDINTGQKFHFRHFAEISVWWSCHRN